MIYVNIKTLTCLDIFDFSGSRSLAHVFDVCILRTDYLYS